MPTSASSNAPNTANLVPRLIQALGRVTRRTARPGLAEAPKFAPLFDTNRFISFFTYVKLHGWVFNPVSPLVGVAVRQDGTRHGEVAVGLPSPDVDLAPNLRFELTAQVPGLDWSKAVVEFIFADGTVTAVTADDIAAQYKRNRNIAGQEFGGDPAFETFFNTLLEGDDGTILELGSRARSGIVRRDWFPLMNYIGVDIVAGDNVDVVCDAHLLSSKVPHNSVDGVFSAATFEHLIMPWKVAIELNRVMRVGAVGYIRTHQTLGMHDVPWDYWRYSDAAWAALFNRHTGFEIMATYLGDPLFVVPHLMGPEWYGHETSAGFSVSSVTFRKVAETTLTWDVPVEGLVGTQYPG
jgi:hypothetical protein